MPLDPPPPFYRHPVLLGASYAIGIVFAAGVALPPLMWVLGLWARYWLR
jgi:hypothetical protein